MKIAHVILNVEKPVRAEHEHTDIQLSFEEMMVQIERHYPSWTSMVVTIVNERNRRND